MVYYLPPALSLSRAGRLPVYSLLGSSLPESVPASGEGIFSYGTKLGMDGFLSAAQERGAYMGFWGHSRCIKPKSGFGVILGEPWKYVLS